MTVQERQEIFAKEYISIADVEKLYGMTYSHASKFLTDIKRSLTIGRGATLRIDIQGKLHVLDYLDWLGVTSDRYCIGAKTDIA